jgi:hypothetical protein
MIAADLDAAREAGAGARLEIAVRTDAARVGAFAAATCALEPGAPAVPLTFPFCWMTAQEVRPTLEHMIGDAALLPIHEAQSFDYARALALDADYLLALTFTRTTSPERLTVTAAIATPQGEPCARFETVLRLVPRAAAPGPSQGASDG